MSFTSKEHLLPIVLIAIAIVIGFYVWFSTRPTTTTVVLITDPKNATYVIDGKPVTLQNGKASVPAAPDSAEKITTQIFGEPSVGDLNGDGVSDYGMILERQSGGTGTFYYVAVALTNASTTEVSGLNTIFFGDRVAPQNVIVANEKILLNYADRNPDEPMSAEPSVGVSKYFQINDGILTELRTPKISLDEARDIAKKSACGKAGRITSGTSSPSVFFNENSGTWWLKIFPDAPRQDCNPDCVVDDTAKTAEINWMCTGLRKTN